MEYKDYYAILGVNKTATPDEIKHAYRRLARKYHPDVSKEAHAEDKFKDLQEAYEVLKDPEKKTAYDQLGANWKAGQEFRPPPGWEGNQARSRFYTADDLGGFEQGADFSDFFANLFGGRAQHNGSGEHFSGSLRRRGGDQQAKISITLEEAFSGTTKTFQLQIPDRQAPAKLHADVRTIKLTIPAGAFSGQQLRLAKQGMPGMGGGPAGDLYLEIEVEPHPLFSLKGRDVYLTLPVAPWEAALGAALKVPTLAGKVGLKLAPGSQAGQKLRLKGRGMPGAEPGDQYVVIQIEVPPASTPEQRQYYEKMAQVLPFDPRKHWPV